MRTETCVWGVLAALVFPAEHVVAQCNDLARHVDEKAGAHGKVDTSCTVVKGEITIGVATVEFETPSECTVSYTDYMSHVYECGPEAEDSHCKAQGYKVAWKKYEGGGCPPIPTDAEELKKAIASGINCVKPKVVKTSYDWSASVMDCNGNGPGATQLEHGTVITIGSDGEASDSYIVWHGNPDELLPAAQESVFTGALDHLMTLDPASLPFPLESIHAQHPPIEAFSLLDGVARFDHHDGGAVEEHTFSGTLKKEGLFRFRVERVASGISGSATFATDMSFDGSSFFIGQVGTDYYNAYSASSPGRDRVLFTEAAFVRPLWQWTRNPFAIALSEDVVYDQAMAPLPGGLSLHQPKQVLKVTEQFHAEADAATDYYIDVDGASPVPLVVDILDAEGIVTDRVEYGGFAEVQQGVRRPMKMVETVYDHQGQPLLTTTLDLTTATPAVTLPWDVPRIEHLSEKWLVRTATDTDGD